MCRCIEGGGARWLTTDFADGADFGRGVADALRAFGGWTVGGGGAVG